MAVGVSAAPQHSVLMPDGVYSVLCVGSRHVMTYDLCTSTLYVSRVYTVGTCGRSASATVA